MTLERTDIMNSGHFSTHNFQKEGSQCARVSGVNIILRNGHISSNNRVKGSVTAIGFDISAKAKAMTTDAYRFQDGLRTYHA